MLNIPIYFFQMVVTKDWVVSVLATFVNCWSNATVLPSSARAEGGSVINDAIPVGTVPPYDPNGFSQVPQTLCPPERSRTT